MVLEAEIKVSAWLVSSEAPRGNPFHASLLASGAGQQSLALLGVQMHHSNLCSTFTWPSLLCVSNPPLLSKDTSHWS